MKGFRKLGIGLTGSNPSSVIMRYAKLADAGGLDSFWFAENYHNRSVTSLAAAVSTITKRISIALGIVNTHTRHPGLLAMEAATLSELSGGRFILGLGTALHVMSKHRISRKEAIPVQRMKECVAAVRRLLAGEMLSKQGKVFGFWNKGVRMGLKTPIHVPIVVGCTGPKMLKLAGEIADGVMFDPACSVGYTKYALDIIRDSASKAGRDPSSIDTIAYFIFSVGKDGAKARNAARLLTGSYIARVLPIMNQKAGISEELVTRLREAFERNDSSALSKNVSDETLGKVAVAGTVDDCISTLANYAKVGLKHAVLYEVFGPEPEHAIRLVIDEMYPNLIQK